MLETSGNVADAAAALMQKAGYRAEVLADGAYIGSGASGMKFIVMPKATNLQFRALVEQAAGFDVDLIKVNDFNRKYRYGKVYIDPDGDLVLEADFGLIVERDTAEADIRVALELWEGLIGIMRDTLVEQTEEASGETPA